MAAGKLFFVGIFLCCALLQRGAAQTGFISIDCGSTVSYTDGLGLDWVGDEGYASNGANAVIDTKKANLGPDALTDQRKLQTLRYFPEPAGKFCYDIPVGTAGQYLIRMTFLAGNWSSVPANFSVSLGAAHWQDLTIDDPWTPLIKEASFFSLQVNLPICFQRGASGFPFVNSIEVRPLNTGYQFSIPQYVMTTIFRIDCGRKPGSPSIRYPDDPVDRLWAADPQNFSFPTVTNTSMQLESTIQQVGNHPPPVVLQTAWNASKISFKWPVSYLPKTGPIDEGNYYIALYFVDITGLNSADPRLLDVYLDGAVMNRIASFNIVNTSFPVTATETYQAASIKIYNSSVDVSVVPSVDSSVPVAILNAVEAWRWQSYNSSVITSTVAVQAIEGIKEHFNLSLWEGDPCLAWPYDWLRCTDLQTSGNTTVEVTSVNLSKFNLTGTIPTVIGDLAELTGLALANNNLSGSIPDLSGLTKLQSLLLRNNRLSGPIPEFLGSLPLTILSLDDNLFEGEVPTTLQEKIDSGQLTFSATNNPLLCLGGNKCTQAPTPSPQESSGKKSSSTGVIIGAAVGGVVVLFLILLFFYWRFSKKPHPKPAGEGVAPEGGAASKHSANSYSWSEVSTMTKDFSRLLGKGGFGDVYYGEPSTGQKVAVKVNKGNTRHGNQQFLNEVSLLSRVHHRHLVSLIGFCSEGNHEILIYEYMAQGTLEDHIRGKRNTSYGPLNWKTRLDILLNSSRGIEYLHHSCNPPIIHRDIKTANILLNEQLLAKVSDFGISKPVMDDKRTRGVTTEVKGTFGYLDPAYFRDHLASEKTDVYSFGVVLLEVITGKPPTAASFPNSRASNLLDWVKSEMRTGNIVTIVDPNMGTNYRTESVWKVAELAVSCLRSDLSQRPNMAQVLQDLMEAMEHENHDGGIDSVNIYPSPSDLSPSVYDQYQRISQAPRWIQNNSRNNSITRLTNDDFFTASTNPRDTYFTASTNLR